MEKSLKALPRLVDELVADSEAPPNEVLGFSFSPDARVVGTLLATVTYPVNVVTAAGPGIVQVIYLPCPLHFAEFAPKAKL